MANISKIPPHSIEAEQSVLGSVLIDKDSLIKIADLLLPDDFYDPKHAIIWSAMLDHYRTHTPIDLLTLSHSLEIAGDLEKIGGGGYLAELTSIVPTASHIFSYAQMVKQKSTLRKMLKAGDTIMALGYEEGKEMNELLATAEKTVFNITQTFLKDRFVHIKDVLDSRFEAFAELHESDDKDSVKGVPSGFASIDHLLGGFQPSDLIILAARPSMGKTALALNFAQNAAVKHKKTVGIFSLEMSKEQLVDRLFCSIVGVDSWKLKKGKLSDSDFASLGPAMDDLSRAAIFIDDSVGASITEVKAKARRLQMEHGLDLIIIDYLQLMTADSAVSAMGNRVQEISEISRALKQLGRELRVPVIALSQLSRAVEMRPGKIPQLSDLRDSGSIEQDADVVFMLYREDYYEPDSDRKGRADVFIRKNRNGPTDSLELSFVPEQMRFYDIDKANRSKGPMED